MKTFFFRDSPDEEGVSILVGERSGENEFLVRGENPSHTWLHMEKFPSCHVVIRADSPSEECILEAASYCMMFSKKRSGSVSFLVTKVGNLLPGEREGEVTFSSNRKCRRLVRTFRKEG
jgi:predicted ribosome quality control (RQC) complex YloA/Tae2 family protein